MTTDERGTGAEAAAVAPLGASSLIAVERLGRTIGGPSNATVILEDLSFTVGRASLFAINGPSGSGKSTLLNLMTGLDRPTSRAAPGRAPASGRYCPGPRT